MAEDKFRCPERLRDDLLYDTKLFAVQERSGGSHQMRNYIARLSGRCNCPLEIVGRDCVSCKLFEQN